MLNILNLFPVSPYSFSISIGDFPAVKISNAIDYSETFWKQLKYIFKNRLQYLKEPRINATPLEYDIGRHSVSVKIYSYIISLFQSVKNCSLYF